MGCLTNKRDVLHGTLQPTCPTQGQDIPETGATTEQRQVRKFLRDGVLYIQVGTTTYTLSGYIRR